MSRKREEERFFFFLGLRKMKHLDFPGQAYGVQHVRRESDGGAWGLEHLRTHWQVAFQGHNLWFVLLRDGLKSVGVRFHLSLDFVSNLAGCDVHKRPRANSFVPILGAPWHLNLSIADYVTASVVAPLQTDRNLHVLDVAPIFCVCVQVRVCVCVHASIATRMQ